MGPHAGWQAAPDGDGLVAPAERKTMTVIAQIGRSAAAVRVDRLDLEERQAVVGHRILIYDYLSNDPRMSTAAYERLIRAYEGRMTGGANPVEFANDPEAIVRLAIEDPDDVDLNNFYPQESG
jgi:hypothetical protein